MTVNHITSKVLQKYQIYPQYVEDFGKVRKIYTQHKKYALKEINVNDFMLPQAYFYLAKCNYKQVVPIYPTVDQDYSVVFNNKRYYLMPWMESSTTDMYTSNKNIDLLREIALLHKATMSENTILENELEKHYDYLMQKWEKRQQVFYDFIRYCEGRPFMSPFELQYCLHYAQIRNSERTLKKRLDSWYEEAKESLVTRKVLSHGKVHINHLVDGGNGTFYLLNFERARITSPNRDMIYYFRKCLVNRTQHIYDLVPCFKEYMSHSPLLSTEISLFSYHLLEAEMFYSLINRYKENKNKSELAFVREFQKSIWYLQDAHFFVQEMEKLQFAGENED